MVCMYIDLNMVRAGVVAHPLEWFFSGYCVGRCYTDNWFVLFRQGIRTVGVMNFLAG